MVSNIQKKRLTIALLGDRYSGKTQIIRVFLDYYYDEPGENTLIDHFSKDIKINEEYEVNLKIIDTGGNEKLQDVAIEFYISNSNAVIFVFNLERRNTFLGVSRLLNKVKDKYNDKYFFLFGNACESAQREVKQDEIDNFIKENNNMPYFEVSAKNNINIKESFHNVAEFLYDKFQEKNQDIENLKKEKITKENNKTNKINDNTKSEDIIDKNERKLNDDTISLEKLMKYKNY